jgi:hypothetical protein
VSYWIDSILTVRKRCLIFLARDLFQPKTIIEIGTTRNNKWSTLAMSFTNFFHVQYMDRNFGCEMLYILHLILINYLTYFLDRARRFYNVK